MVTWLFCPVSCLEVIPLHPLRALYSINNFRDNFTQIKLSSVLKPPPTSLTNDLSEEKAVWRMYFLLETTYYMVNSQKGVRRLIIQHYKCQQKFLLASIPQLTLKSGCLCIICKYCDIWVKYTVAESTTENHPSKWGSRCKFPLILKPNWPSCFISDICF